MAAKKLETPAQAERRKAQASKSFLKKMAKLNGMKSSMTDEQIAEVILTRLRSVERQTADLVKKVALAEDGVHNILMKVNQLIKMPYRPNEIRGIVKGVHELTKALNDIMVRTT